MLGGCFLSGKNKNVWTLLPTDLQGLGLQSYEEDEFFSKDKCECIGRRPYRE
jgi:hypothetical protein